jgi:hypothetical protein
MFNVYASYRFKEKSLSQLYGLTSIKVENLQFRVLVGSRSCREIQQKIREDKAIFQRDQPYQ